MWATLISIIKSFFLKKVLPLISKKVKEKVVETIEERREKEDVIYVTIEGLKELKDHYKQYTSLQLQNLNLYRHVLSVTLKMHNIEEFSNVMLLQGSVGNCQQESIDNYKIVSGQFDIGWKNVLSTYSVGTIMRIEGDLNLDFSFSSIRISNCKVLPDN